MFRAHQEPYQNNPNDDTLTSINKIINAEAKQRMLEDADSCDPGHPLGICCDNCQGKNFTTFGVHREKRQDAPEFQTVLYMHCAKCGEMIFLVCQSTDFVPCGPGQYKPHWNIMEGSNSQIQQASIKHFDAIEKQSGENAKNMIAWIGMAKDLID